MKSVRMTAIGLAVTVLLAALVTGCSLPIPLPGQGNDGGGLKLPAELGNLGNLGDLNNILGDLGLPDLSDLADLPGLDSLPLGAAPPGSIVYRGPIERRVTAGNLVPGTDFYLVGTDGESAQFTVIGLTSVRTVGDSIDYDGPLPGVPGAEYSARLRIYRVSDGRVRVAGVHQLTIDGINAQQGEAGVHAQEMKFPFTAHVSAGSNIPGTTYGYIGENERGAELSGLPADAYPYRKVGDSVSWTGKLRPDIGVEYNVRVLFYDQKSAQVGGVVTVSLPMEGGG